MTQTTESLPLTWVDYGRKWELEAKETVLNILWVNSKQCTFAGSVNQEKTTIYIINATNDFQTQAILWICNAHSHLTPTISNTLLHHL
jgi:hypothetical protein